MLLTDLKLELLTGIVKPARNVKCVFRIALLKQFPLMKRMTLLWEMKINVYAAVFVISPVRFQQLNISFPLEEDENGEKIVNVTVKASNLNEEVVMGWVLWLIVILKLQDL